MSFTPWNPANPTEHEISNGLNHEYDNVGNFMDLQPQGLYPQFLAPGNLIQPNYDLTYGYGQHGQSYPQFGQPESYMNFGYNNPQSNEFFGMTYEQQVQQMQQQCLPQYHFSTVIPQYSNFQPQQQQSNQYLEWNRYPSLYGMEYYLPPPLPPTSISSENPIPVDHAIYLTLGDIATPSHIEQNLRESKSIITGQEGIVDAVAINSKTKINEKKKLHVCRTCQKQLATSATLKRHMKIHTRETSIAALRTKSGEITKDDSPETTKDGELEITKVGDHETSNDDNLAEFPTISYLEVLTTTENKNENNQEVMKTITNEEEKSKTMNPLLQCLTCLKKFPYQSALTRHMKTHNTDKTYYLKNHMRIHSKVRPYECNVCHKSFMNAYILKIHMRVHTNERPYKCTDCTKSYITPGALTIHKRNHTKKDLYKCKQCPKSFITSSALKVHTRTHTRERAFKCYECNKAFSSAGSLKEHKHIHTNVRPYNCKECPKTFITARYLKYHMQTHAGERLYKCNTCDKSYYHACNLNRHLKIHASV